MDQFLNKIFRYIPEWLFVLIILGVGVLFLFYDNPLVSVCDAQISDFAKGQQGKLFPRTVKVLNPLTGGAYFDNILAKSRDRCIDSPKGTGCYKYFKIIEGVLYDFKKLDGSCLKQLSQTPLMAKVFEDYLITLGLLAWGEYAPMTEAQKTGWLTDTDLKTYCTVKSYYQDFYPIKNWDRIIQKSLSQLAIDPETLTPNKPEANKEKVFGENDLRNDSERAYKYQKAKLTMTKAYRRSLYSMDCIYYK